MYSNPSYERKAKNKPSNTELQSKILFAVVGAVCGANAGRGSLKWVLIGVVFGAAVGFFGGWLFVAIIKAPYKKFSRLERSEGYTDATLAEAYNIMNKNPTLNNKNTVALIHNLRGEFSRAAQALSGVDERRFAESPYGAEVYYSQLMLAHALSGDQYRAAQDYDRGAYFMNTYMNSPTCGGYISMALAVREYCLGRYDSALNYLAAADSAFMRGDIREADKLPQDCMWTAVCYWRALCLACKGMTDIALSNLERTNGMYTTDYYKAAIEKLRADIGKENI